MAEEHILRLKIDPSGAVRGAREFDQATDRVQRGAAGVDKSMLRMQQAAIVSFAAIAASSAAAVMVTRRLVQLGAEAGETANKFDVVFGASAGRAREELERLADSVPLTRSEMERMAAGLQDMLVPMGVLRSEAANLSVDAVRLAADIGSLNNAAPIEVLQAMQSALAGQSEPMLRFGVDTRATRLEVLALEDGLISAGQEMSNTARAQAVMIAATRDSSDALGDAARTADSVANATKLLSRDIRQTAEDIGIWYSESLAASGALTDVRVSVGEIMEVIRSNEDLIRDVMVEGFQGTAEAIDRALGLMAPFIENMDRVVALTERLQAANAGMAVGGPVGGVIGFATGGPDEGDRLDELSEKLQRINRGIGAAIEDRQRAEAQAAVERQRQLEEERKEAERIARARQDALDDEIDLLASAVQHRINELDAVDRLLQLSREQRAIRDDLARSDAERLAAAERELQIQQGIAAAMGRRGGGGGGVTGEVSVNLTGNLEERIREMQAAFGDLEAGAQRTAPAVRDAGDSLLDMSDAALGGLVSVADGFGLLDRESRAAVRGLSDLISGIQGIRSDGLGSVAGISGAFGIAGGIAGILGSLFGDDQAERVRQASRDFNEALDAFVAGLEDTSRWDALRQDAQDEAVAVAQKMVDAYLATLSQGVRDRVGPSFDAIFDAFAAGTITLDEMFAAFERMFGADAQAIMEVYEGHLQRIEEQRRAEQEAIGQNLQVQILRAQGLDEEAQALEDQIAIQEALADGWDQANIDALAHVQALKAEARAQAEAARAAEQLAGFMDQLATMRAQASGNPVEIARVGAEIQAANAIDNAQQLLDDGIIGVELFNEFVALWSDAVDDAVEAARDAAMRQERAQRHASDQFMRDVEARELALAGDDRGALEAQLRADAEAAMFRAREMLRAGEITQEGFDRLVAVIEGETVDALEDFDRAAREAAEAAREAAEAERFRAEADKENLRVQILRAQGLDEEAQQMADQLAIMQAIQDERDEEYLALLRQLQGIQAQNRAEEERRRAIDETTRSITGMTSALNAPSGFPINRLRADVAQGFGVQSPSFTGGGGSTSVQIQSGAIVVHAAAGQDVEAVAREVADKVQKIWNNEGRAGGTFTLPEASI